MARRMALAARRGGAVGGVLLPLHRVARHAKFAIDASAPPDRLGHGGPRDRLHHALPQRACRSVDRQQAGAAALRGHRPGLLRDVHRGAALPARLHHLRERTAPPAATCDPSSDSQIAFLEKQITADRPLAKLQISDGLLALNEQPAAALVGLSASPLWSAQGLMITHLAVGFATDRRSPDVASATGSFNGVFECAYGALTNIVGSVLSSLAFTYGDHVTQPDGSPSPPTDGTVQALFSLFLCFLSVGIALVVFGLPEQYTTPPLPSTKRDLPTTLRLLRERRMYMILPLVVSSGLLSGFVTADFTRSVIVPSLGFDSIGFVLAINGSAGAVAFLLLGKMIDVVNRSAVVAVGLAGFGTMITALLLFPPPPPDGNRFSQHLCAYLWLSFTGFLRAQCCKQPGALCVCSAWRGRSETQR